MSMSGKLYKLTRVRTLTLRKSLSRGRAQETVAHHGGNSRFQLDNPAVSRTPEEISKPVYRGKEWQGSRIRPRLRKGIRCCRSKSQERLCYRIHSLRGTLCPQRSPTQSLKPSLGEKRQSPQERSSDRSLEKDMSTASQPRSRHNRPGLALVISRGVVFDSQ